MIPQQPPLWLQRALLPFLKLRDRETISGDLLEEYREEQLPRLGARRANCWYTRQLISLAFTRIAGGQLMKHLLVLLSVFLIAAGAWLGVMENILKHDGYTARSLVAACIALQGVATILFLRLDGRATFRVFVITGAAAIILLGASAMLRILRAQHFEGFVLVIGLGLILQGVLTLAALLPTRSTHSA